MFGGTGSQGHTQGTGQDKKRSFHGGNPLGRGESQDLGEGKTVLLFWTGEAPLVHHPG